MSRFHITLLALSLAFTSGCLNDVGLQADPGAYVPDEPADEEVEEGQYEDEDEQDIEDEDEQDIEDEDEQDIEDEDEQDIEDEDEDEQDIEDEDELIEATDDSDTFDDPLFYYSFLGSGTADNVTVADEVSAPFGDVHDWVGFTTPAPQNSLVNVTITLLCDSDDVRGQLFEDENSGPLALGGSYQVGCGDTDTFLIPINSDYLVRVFFPNGTDEQTLVPWEMTVSW